MRIIILIAFCLLCCPFFVQGQANQPVFGGTEEHRMVGIRLHNSMSIRRAEARPGTGSTQVDFLQPSAGIFWGKKPGQVMELQVTRMHASTKTGETYVLDTVSGRQQVIKEYKGTAVDVALRGEMVRTIPSISGEHLRFMIGVGAEASFLYNRFQPLTSSLDFPREELGADLSAAVSARMSYQLSGRWSLDFLLPFNLMRFGVRSLTEDNPVVPIEQRTLNSFEFDMFPDRYGLRIGLSAAL